MSELRNAGCLVRTPGAEQLVSVLISAGADVELLGSERLAVRGMPMEEIGEKAYAAGIVLHELSAQTGTLEDLFLNWTSEGAGEAGVVHL